MPVYWEGNHFRNIAMWSTSKWRELQEVPNHILLSYCQPAVRVCWLAIATLYPNSLHRSSLSILVAGETGDVLVVLVWVIGGYDCFLSPLMKWVQYHCGDPFGMAQVMVVGMPRKDKCWERRKDEGTRLKGGWDSIGCYSSSCTDFFSLWNNVTVLRLLAVKPHPLWHLLFYMSIPHQALLVLKAVVGIVAIL